MKYTTKDIVNSEVEGFVDALYSYLAKEGDNEIFGTTIKAIFSKCFEADPDFDLSFVLDGQEEESFADYTYFRSEEYAGLIYLCVPCGEIEIELKTYNQLADEDKDNWTVNGQYAYHEIPAYTIVYKRETLEELAEECFTDLWDSLTDEGKEKVIDEEFAYLFGNTSKVAALCEAIEVPYDEISDISENKDCQEYSYGRAEYLVLSDDEREEIGRERVESYVDECVLSEMPDNLQSYFDTDRFIADVLRYDGYGHVIASYDGNEFEQGDFYIYRTN